MMDKETLIRVVDDDDSVRNGLEYLLRMEGWKVKTFPSGLSFLQGDSPSVPGAVIIDVRMPGMSGLELQDELIRRKYPHPVIFLSGHGDIGMAVKAVKKGAANFLQKPVNPGELVEVIRECMEQEEKRQELSKEAAQALLQRLTPRERQITALILQGLTNTAIAGRLGLSVRTVENHREAVYRKMNVNSLPALKSKLDGQLHMFSGVFVE
ncbi:response regulator transcription factor [Mesosutterella porci]|nr:response regulator [Mesosutterella sp. oilRF-744-WT-GAM-9]